MKAPVVLLVLLVAAFGWALTDHLTREIAVAKPGLITLHLSHRYLESGYRAALDVVIRDFEEYHRRRGTDVRVVQHALPRRYYDQWLTTNLVAKSAPDIIEIDPNWQRINYLLQNFLRLDSLISRPNPFNDLDRLVQDFGDVDLHRNLSDHQRRIDPRFASPYRIADAVRTMDPALKRQLLTTPMKDTYLDGMLGGFNFRLGSYYSFPTSSATWRIFYNATLLKELGYTTPPVHLDEFFTLCEKIKARRDANGDALIPIAAYREPTGAPMELLENRYAAPFTYRDSLARDWELTGNPQDYYIFLEWQAGRWSFETPSARAYYQLARRLASYSTPGFLAIERDQATFSFMQQQAAMIVSSAFDAAHFFHDATFDVGIMEYPMPGPDDPQGWSKFARIPAREGSGAAGLFGLNSRSEHPELARSFVEFITSYIWNERFNAIAQLVPCVIGTKTSDALKPFRQIVGGIHEANVFLPRKSSDNPYIESDYRGQFWTYLSRQIEDDEAAYAAFVAALEKRFNDPAYGVDRIWSNKRDNSIRESRMQDRLLNLEAAASLLLGTPVTDENEQAKSLLRNADENNGTNILLEFRQHFRGTGREFPKL